jgi:CelD/BcsL family acetyltransferase involved in cellulose biosynthesis
MTAGLMIEDRLIAGFIAIRNGSHLVLSQLAHDPELDDLSPAACLLHELPNALRGTSATTIDLTPGGDYKKRFATSWDTAHAIDVSWGLAASSLLVARREIGPLIRRIQRRLRARQE